MKRLMGAKYTAYTAYTATAKADPTTGKLKPPARGAVSTWYTWCKESSAAITPDMINTYFKVCGLTLALDGSEDHAWCTHNFGEGCRELLQQQRVGWEARHPDVSLPGPSYIPVVSDGHTLGTKIPSWLQRKGARLLPSSSGGGSDIDAVVMEDNSDVEWLEGPEDGDEGVAARVELRNMGSWEYR